MKAVEFAGFLFTLLLLIIFSIYAAAANQDFKLREDFTSCLLIRNFTHYNFQSLNFLLLVRICPELHSLSISRPVSFEISLSHKFCEKYDI